MANSDVFPTKDSAGSYAGRETTWQACHCDIGNSFYADSGQPCIEQSMQMHGYSPEQIETATTELGRIRQKIDAAFEQVEQRIQQAMEENPEANGGMLILELSIGISADAGKDDSPQ